MMKLTENELLSALREAVKVTKDAKDTSGFCTREELQDALGWGRSVTRERLRKLHKAGRLEVGFRMVTDITGRPARVPTYKITKGKR